MSRNRKASPEEKLRAVYEYMEGKPANKKGTLHVPTFLHISTYPSDVPTGNRTQNYSLGVWLTM